MINAILTIMAVVVCSFAAAFVVGAGAYTWAFRSRHYPQESRRGLRRNPDLPWIVGSLVAGLVILTLACWPAFAGERCVSFDQESDRANEEARSLDRIASTMVGEPGTADAMEHAARMLRHEARLLYVARLVCGSKEGAQ